MRRRLPGGVRSYSMSTVIEVDNLRKAYGDVVAIDGVSFQVR